MTENDVNIYVRLPVEYADALTQWARENFGFDGTPADAVRAMLPSFLDLPPITKIYLSQDAYRKQCANRRKEIYECVERLGSHKAASIELGMSVRGVSNAWARHWRRLHVTAHKIEQETLA